MNRKMILASLVLGIALIAASCGNKEKAAQMGAQAGDTAKAAAGGFLGAVSSTGTSTSTSTSP